MVYLSKHSRGFYSCVKWFEYLRQEMPSSRPTQCSSSSSRTRQTSRARILLQTTLDAELNAEYEVSGDSFDYPKLVEAQRTTSPEQGPSEKVIAYLQHIQRGKLIQPFACLLTLDDKSFMVITFSENALEMLTTVSHVVPSVDDPPKLGIATLFCVLRPSCHPRFDPPSLPL